MMVDRINDIGWQASQGSVAAIIQVLNQKLADSGVRTRAVFADDVLQLLCEARTADKLEQVPLVEQIQQILNDIAPRNIYRVNINSRIVREQQLLWLEEINRDPSNQLLWSEEIYLKKPSFFQKIIKDFTERNTESGIVHLPKTSSSVAIVITDKDRAKKSPWNPVFLSLSLCLSLLMIGWALYALLGARTQNLLERGASQSLPSTAKSLEPTNTSPANAQATSVAPRDNASANTDDPFAAAVRIANQASDFGRKAKTSAQWLDLAARWQRASDLMNSVPPDHSRYREAQIRTKLYKKYSDEAQKKANAN